MAIPWKKWYNSSIIRLYHSLGPKKSSSYLPIILIWLGINMDSNKLLRVTLKPIKNIIFILLFSPLLYTLSKLREWARLGEKNHAFLFSMGQRSSTTLPSRLFLWELNYNLFGPSCQARSSIKNLFCVLLDLFLWERVTLLDGKKKMNWMAMVMDNNWYKKDGRRSKQQPEQRRRTRGQVRRSGCLPLPSKARHDVFRQPFHHGRRKVRVSGARIFFVRRKQRLEFPRLEARPIPLSASPTKRTHKNITKPRSHQKRFATFRSRYFFLPIF